MVTRLNTMHKTDGVIANAPGPLNLTFRCLLEENGQIDQGRECNLLYIEYGSASAKPASYDKRSLLNYTDGYTSDILFVQGLQDGPIQMHSWPVFKQKVQACSDCQHIQFLDLPGFGHAALFHSQEAKNVFNNFIGNK